MGEVSEAMDRQSIDALESTLRQLQDAVKDLGNSSDIDELLLLIHNPGWTTTRDHFFVTSIAEALTQQLQTASRMKQVLIAGSRSIDAGDDGPILEDLARKKKPFQPPPAPQPPPGGGPPGGEGSTGGEGGDGGDGGGGED
jgi:hypothetical protein